MSWLSDPRLFNFAIIAMFIAAAIRWACVRNWPQVTYWLAAAVLNVATLPGVSK